jgi:hypothetical protein
MENEGTTQVASPETGASSEGGVDQTSYVSDAWDKGYFRSHEAELNPQAAQKQAETPKAPVEQKAETPKDPNSKATQPDNQAPQKSRFETAFSGEDGEIDIDKFMGFNLPAMKVESVQFESQNPATPTAPEKAPWEKDMEEITTMSTKLKGDMLDPLQKVADLIAQGKEPLDALNEVYLERQSSMEKMVNEEKTKREFQRQKALEDRLNEKTREEKISEQVKINTNEIVSALPGNTPEEKTALFEEIFFGKDVGKVILDREFDKAVPDNAKMNPEQKRVAATKFVNSILSNKAELRYLFDQCMDRTTRANLPKIMAKVRMSAVAADKANRLSAQKGPVSTQPRTQPGAAQKGAYDSYFNSHNAADRI